MITLTNPNKTNSLGLPSAVIRKHSGHSILVNITNSNRKAHGLHMMFWKSWPAFLYAVLTLMFLFRRKEVAVMVNET